MTKKELRLELIRQENEAWETLQLYKQAMSEDSFTRARQSGEWQTLNRINRMLSDAEFGEESK